MTPLNMISKSARALKSLFLPGKQTLDDRSKHKDGVL
jgi:hypothetical protein